MSLQEIIQWFRELKAQGVTKDEILDVLEFECDDSDGADCGDQCGGRNTDSNIHFNAHDDSLTVFVGGLLRCFQRLGSHFFRQMITPNFCSGVTVFFSSQKLFFLKLPLVNRMVGIPQLYLGMAVNL